MAIKNNIYIYSTETYQYLPLIYCLQNHTLVHFEYLNCLNQIQTNITWYTFCGLDVKDTHYLRVLSTKHWGMTAWRILFIHLMVFVIAQAQAHLLFYFCGQAISRGLLVKFQVWDHNGNVTTYEGLSTSLHHVFALMALLSSSSCTMAGFLIPSAATNSSQSS